MVIKLDKPVDCGNICKQIQKLIIRNIKTQDMAGKALSIRIVDIIDQTDKQTGLLEYKG